MGLISLGPKLIIIHSFMEVVVTSYMFMEQIIVFMKHHENYPILKVVLQELSLDHFNSFKEPCLVLTFRDFDSFKEPCQVLTFRDFDSFKEPCLVLTFRDFDSFNYLDFNCNFAVVIIVVDFDHIITVAFVTFELNSIDSKNHFHYYLAYLRIWNLFITVILIFEVIVDQFINSSFYNFYNIYDINT